VVATGNAEALPLSLFDYDFPPELVATAPANPRGSSRLMTMSRSGGQVNHLEFSDLPTILRSGDVLVVNTTRVIAARLHGCKSDTGGRVELLLDQPAGGFSAIEKATTWVGLAKSSKPLRLGTTIRLESGELVEIVARDLGRVSFRAARPIIDIMRDVGELPVPPYILDARSTDSEQHDEIDYQSVFAQDAGAVAAPTASLHFTETLIGELAEHGVGRAEVLLHVGPGTFLPVRDDCERDIRHHRMHGEHYAVAASTWEYLRGVRADGGRVIAVGTTALRALETVAKTGQLSGRSELFAFPGFEFEVVDGLLTNFHWPRSTLLMLVAAFAGLESTLSAYQDAIASGYRLFSYGDAMLIS